MATGLRPTTTWQPACLIFKFQIILALTLDSCTLLSLYIIAHCNPFCWFVSDFDLHSVSSVWERRCDDNDLSGFVQQIVFDFLHVLVESMCRYACTPSVSF